ncbi:alpha-2-macroglobulin family protein [Nitratireductor pacificus]|uniref:Alpha-2-macroglobulin-like protein n=1 Tax=Nitratireductor pacificus pht-3B TaxID=391937 RepID=K2LLY9_9HYPH|nr:alpha-2-macroglobulin family protein [Nitratireductor pacificus]EKF18784.1 alpha-2-macroglobulin-like protein [Nitratireductor pacificus pht-3B]
MRAARGLSLFLALFFGITLSAAAQDARRIVTSDNGDYFGFDLRTEQDVSLDQCKAACLGDAQCRAFTYNTRAEWCFLKSDFNRLNSFDDAVAGKVVTAGGGEDIGAAPELRFVPEHVLREAEQYRGEVMRDANAGEAGFVSLVSGAGQALASGNARGAMHDYQAAIAVEPENAALWTGLARAVTAMQLTGNESIYALQRAGTGAGVIAYDLSRSTEGRADALAALAGALERRNLFRPALSAYEASLALQPAPQVQALYADLKRRKGFRVLDHTVDSDSASPRVCVQFSEDLVKSGIDYAKYMTVENQRSVAIDQGDKELCVAGLKHGEQYRIVVRQGLPAAIGEVIAEPVPLEIYVRDRAPSLRFTGDNFVLPSSARRGIPFVSVNAASAKLVLYRVGDRGLARLLTESKFLRQLDGYEVDQVADEMGEPVWEGTVEIASELNKDVVTSIPIDEAVPERRPGIYMLTAVPEGDTSETWNSRATQWFLVSDIGLSTFTGNDGLSVFARSLASAAPAAGLKLKLLARNNEVLGEAETDADGRAVFSPGLSRGTAGLAPAAIIAENGEDDFVFLDMTRAGFDLSDRGVTGRPSPGPLDAFAWTERGIYRAGETVHASALLRDPSADAVDDLPLTFIFRRPDGVESRRIVSQGADLGGHGVDLPLPETAMRGTWTLSIHTDPKQTALSEKTFLVEDFVPDRTEFDLTSADAEIPVGGATQVTLDGRYLYGAPATGMTLEGQLTIDTTRAWEAFPGYVFGLEDEEDVDASRTALTGLPETDADGRAVFDISVDNAPSTTQLLTAEVRVQMREAGGRAVERAIDIGIAPQTEMIGIRPEFSGGQVPEGGTANFRVIAVDPDGNRVAMPGIKWSLLKVERRYQWYRNEGSWNYEPITSTSLVQEGTVAATADSEPQIGVSVDWGRYRLEVEGPEADGPISSVEFTSGWYVEASSTETPDGLEVALDREGYAVGDTAKLKIAPRFAGEVLVTVGAESLLQTFTASVPEEGTTLDIPVTEAFGAGAYVTATLYRPGDAAENRLPMRAIGVRWLKVDPGARKLALDLATAEKVRPSETLTIPVSVGGLAAGEEAYVTVAAVDVGILNLTRYEAPDPDGWYFGQRMLGLEMRDIYERLIDGSLGAAGRLRTGGDGGGMTATGSPPTEKLIAFHSGIVRLDAEGKADIAFEIPQFNGTARVMAVAWSKSGVGSAAKDVIIRDPVVLTTSLPRFMAPGDEARLLLEVANTDGPAGDYALTVTTEGAVGADLRSVPSSLTLAAGGKTSLSLPLSAQDAGPAGITVALSHPSGLAVEKTVGLQVRPGVMPVASRRVVALAANGGSLTLDGELLADSFADGASVSVSVSRAEAFDIPALLMSLDRYPYGCAEQTTSRALPLLYVSELSKAAGLEDDPAIKERIEDAIRRVLSYQSSSGSFGMWGPGSGDLWLDAYVTDFLTRAREQGFPVAEQAMAQALQNLQNSLAYDTDVQSRGGEIAYALYVMARNRKASAGDLRYYLDTRLDDFATPLARAQLAAGVALYGDAQRAETGFASAFRLAQAGRGGYSARSDYGSRLRDGAALLALAAESRPEPALVPQMIGLVSDMRGATRYMSTQDEAWMLLAARALSQSSDDIALIVDGTAHSGAFSRRMSGAEVSSTPLTLANRGTDPVNAVITTVAAPQQPLPAGGEGFTIARTYYRLDGTEMNVSEARQNERYVVVLNVTEANAWPSRILVSDLLPAGFEIDNPRLVGSADLANFEWLGETSAVHTEFRDDRFIAAFDRNGGSERDFRLAYVVRAVTPGVYTHPAASVEDMYRPQLSARTATGFMEVLGQ